jgi:hypothetical protein
MQSYTEADAVLTGRCAKRRKVSNNTWLERRGDDIAVRLHDTDIVVYHPDGSITLDTGGWFTVTTKARMCEFSPFSVSSTKGEWFVAERNPAAADHDWRSGPCLVPYWHNTVAFRNGMTWHPDKGWEGIADDDELAAERAARNAMRKAIREFVKSITADDVVRHFTDTGGDCFLCLAASSTDDMVPSCLASHVEERYFHAHLALLAVRAANHGDPDYVMSLIYSEAQRGQVSRFLTADLRKYLNRNLLEGVAVR